MNRSHKEENVWDRSGGGGGLLREGIIFFSNEDVAPASSDEGAELTGKSIMYGLSAFRCSPEVWIRT